MLVKLSTALAVTLLGAVAANAELRFQRNGNDVTAITGLYHDDLCTPLPLHGKVIKREFSADEITIKGFIVEQPDGTREYVNVSVPDEGMFNVKLAKSGLQRLIQVGRVVQGRVLWCGAAGRVGTLESIR